MYKKKNRLPQIVAAAVVIGVLGLMVVLRVVKNKTAGAVDTVVQTLQHQVLIYKTSDGTVQFNKDYLVDETNDEVKLNINEDEMVTMLVNPVAGMQFDNLTINDANNITQEERYLANDADGGGTRINFVMPHTDIIMNFSFVEAGDHKDTVPETEKEEVQTEAVAGPPFGLTLHGLTSTIITSYGGSFDDEKFLNQIGNDLGVGQTGSEYRMVTDVTFSDKSYEGDEEPDKVRHYIYFNNDPSWQLLATYYKREAAYVFSEVSEQTESETEQETAQADDNSASDEGTASGTTGTSGGSSSTAGTTVYTGSSAGSGSYSAPVTTTTSFDILQVSKTFLKYVGGEEAFYSNTFDYVLLKGMTGSIVGTMSDYKIYPEENKATFAISLNTGGMITGEYNKSKNSFSYKGL